MKFIIISIIILFFSNLVYSQINLNSKRILIEPFYKIGDNYIYNNSYEKIIVSNSDTLVNETTTHKTELSIIGSTENTITLKWVNSDSYTNSKKESWQLFTKVLNNLNVYIIISKHGTFDSITNWKEIKDSIWSRINNLETEEMTMEGAQDLVELVNVFCASKENIEQKVYPEIFQYFKFHGVKYQFKEIQESILYSKNLMSKDSVETKIYTLIDSLNLKSKTFNIVSKELSNQDQLSKIMKDYYKEKYYLNNLSSDIENDFANCSNTISTNCKYNVLGYVVFSKLCDTFEMPNTIQIQTYTIDLNR